MWRKKRNQNLNALHTNSRSYKNKWCMLLWIYYSYIMLGKHFLCTHGKEELDIKNVMSSNMQGTNKSVIWKTKLTVVMVADYTVADVNCNVREEMCGCVCMCVWAATPGTEKWSQRRGASNFSSFNDHLRPKVSQSPQTPMLKWVKQLGKKSIQISFFMTTIQRVNFCIRQLHKFRLQVMHN